MLTQNTIAKRLGMPRATVAAALNPRLEHCVGAALRERIRREASAMGYVPHRAARRLARGRNGHAGGARHFEQIGLVYVSAASAVVDSVCLAMMQGAEQEISRDDATLAFVRLTEPRHWEKVDR